MAGNICLLCTGVFANSGVPGRNLRNAVEDGEARLVAHGNPSSWAPREHSTCCMGLRYSTDASI